MANNGVGGVGNGLLLIIQLQLQIRTLKVDKLIIQMNRKQSQQPVGSHSQSYQQRGQYQPASPYVELLEAKKGVYGHRYDTKNVRSFTNYVKPSPASISSIFYQKAKPFKSTSTEKVKISSYTNEKKKRSRTEQAEEKMHESLCIYPTVDKHQEENASKSLFYPEHKLSNEFHPSQYFQELTGSKNRRKRHLSENKHTLSDDNQAGGSPLDNLQIADIDGLINLIDNCVSEANEYIAYLSEKMAALKEELLTAKAHAADLQDALNRKNMEILDKDALIKQLDRKLKDGKEGKKDTGFEVKNLLQIIEKISEENEKLRAEVEQLKGWRERKGEEKGEREKQREKEKDPRCDYYNQIHSKIDILNISIDNKHNFHPGGSPSEAKERADRDTAKKYKFIKPRAR